MIKKITRQMTDDRRHIVGDRLCLASKNVPLKISEYISEFELNNKRSIMNAQTYFRAAVEKVFHSWTALKLSMEHSRVYDDDPATVFADIVNYMADYCLNDSKADQFSIRDALDDIMDQEFEAICEDGSTQEIALILHKLAQLIKQGQMETFHEECAKIPAPMVNLPSAPHQVQTQDSEMCSDSSDDDAPQTSSGGDSEWTEVTRRKRR